MNETLAETAGPAAGTLSGLGFSKGHGTGNDFVLVADPEGRARRSLRSRWRHLCDRHRGIGGDGLIRAVPSRLLAEAGRSCSKQPGGRMVHGLPQRGRFAVRKCAATESASSSTSSWPGPGRAASPASPDHRHARAESRRSSAPLTATPSTWAPGSSSSRTTHRREPWIRSSAPTDWRWPGRRCPSAWATRTPSWRWPSCPNSRPRSFSRRPPWTRLPPNGTNVEFVVPAEPLVHDGVGTITMRVHERGVGETQSCGTGACAAAVAIRHWAGQGAPDAWQRQGAGRRRRRAVLHRRRRPRAC